MALTDVQIKNAKPKDRPYKLADGGWLFLLVTETGSKLWRIAYRYGGKEKLLSLGRYPEVSLRDARDKRDEARRLIAAGTDPSQQRRLDKIVREKSAATTFSLVAEEYLDKLRREKRADATIEKKTWLIGLAKPILGARPISEIQPAEVLAVLTPLDKADKLETARRCRETIGAVFRYAIATARASNDPTSALRGAIRTRKPKSYAAITDLQSLGALLRAIEEIVKKAGVTRPPIVLDHRRYIRGRWTANETRRASTDQPSSCRTCDRERARRKSSGLQPSQQGQRARRR